MGSPSEEESEIMHHSPGTEFVCDTSNENLKSRGMFPRVFGDEFGDKFGDEFGDKFSELPNLVIILVMNLVMNLVNCQIR